MGPKLPSAIDRFNSGAASTPSKAGYQLDVLEPRPQGSPSSSGENLSRARLRRLTALASDRHENADSPRDRSTSLSSLSKAGKRPMFAGPPPPISESALIGNASSPSWPRTGPGGSSAGLLNHGLASPGNTVLGWKRDPTVPRAPDTAWRGLRRRQQGIEQDTQKLLDLQAAALLAGSTGFWGPGSGGQSDGHSQAGSATPTDTIYSTATAASRMPKSLHLAPRSTPDGNLIPVRQPRSSRLRGLRAVRNGILRSLTNLSDLKREEDAHVDAALSERKMALTRLRRLDARRSGIRDELKALESDDEEPLGRELRELGSEHDVLEEEIHRLEEKLVGMRNRRRWLRDKMDDVKSRRDAGLSGYRGALRDVDAEISALLHRPPVLPLDQDISRPWKDADAEPEAPAGLAFMRLIPERRTLDMAMAWWETEIRMLERTRALVEEEQQALEQGGAVWEEVVTLVTSFESGLREAMKSGKGSAAPSPATSGEEASAQEDLIRRQLIRMDEVTKELAQRMQLAESKRWNLLICAIGAELEAFREASGMFRRLVAGNDAGLNVTEDTVEKNLTTPSDKSTPGNADPASGGGPGRDCSHEESDNEVPADLLVSHLDDAESLSGTAATLGRGDSSNAVPPEFLVEHDHDRSTLTPMAMP